MAATISSLHIFLRNLQTGWLADLKDRRSTRYSDGIEDDLGSAQKHCRYRTQDDSEQKQ